MRKPRVFKLVPWVQYPNGSEATPVIRVTSADQQAAIRKVRGRFAPGVSITFLQADDLGPLDEYALEILWQSHPGVYIELWEPDITTVAMLRILKQKYPSIWEGLMIW